jgi:IS605 OrfB family transposase
MNTTTKTLQATLVNPTAHKERKLRDTLTTYREALQDSFGSGADTKTGVNDIVTDYDLSSYAKDALKNYVPELVREANELGDGHPVRYTNRGAQFDYAEHREHSFCWRVPYGRNAFWIPLRINPEQRELWHDLVTGDAEAGQLRLQRNRGSWEVQVTVEFGVPSADYDTEDCTPVGLDIGETTLITGCALKRGFKRTGGSRTRRKSSIYETPTRPRLWSDEGSRAKRLRKEMHTTLKRLQGRDADWRTDERFTYFQNALTDIVEKVSREAVEYAREFENPVIVMEDLSYIRERLDYGEYMNRRLHSWAFARLQGRIEDKATEAGVPVEYVPPAYTSQMCHECGHIGSRPHQATFRCTNDDCHVSEFQADINAAANIAEGLDPWGESCRWKTGTDDSPRDGSGRDTATGRRRQTRRPRDMKSTSSS